MALALALCNMSLALVLRLKSSALALALRVKSLALASDYMSSTPTVLNFNTVLMLYFLFIHTLSQVDFYFITHWTTFSL